MSCTGYYTPFFLKSFVQCLLSNPHHVQTESDQLLFWKFNNLLRTNVFLCLRDLLNFEAHFRFYSKRKTESTVVEIAGNLRAGSKHVFLKALVRRSLSLFIFDEIMVVQ